MDSNNITAGVWGGFILDVMQFFLAGALVWPPGAAGESGSRVFVLRNLTRSHTQVWVLGLVRDGRSFPSWSCCVLMDFSYSVRGLGLENENLPRSQVYFSSEKI